MSYATSWCTSILHSEQALSTQVAETLILALLIHVLQEMVRNYIEAKTQHKPWMRNVVAVGKYRFKKTLQLDVSAESVAAFWYNDFAIAFQHFLGGLLVLPVLCGGLGLSAGCAVILARHGALCETGWEVADCIWRFWQTKFHPDSPKVLPPVVMAVMVLHHLTGLLMVIPMNLHFADEPLYHGLVFSLQFAAGSVTFLNAYAMTLDVSRPRDLCQVAGMSVVMFLIVSYTRIWHFLSASYQLLSLFYAKEYYCFFWVGLLAALSMMVLNTLWVKDTFDRSVKFGRLYLTSLGLVQNDTSSEMRAERPHSPRRE